MRLLPAAPQNPGARRRLLCGVRHHRHDLVPVLHVAQIQAHLRLAHAHEVAVAFNESGDGKLSAEVNDLRLRTGECAHVRVRTRGQNLPGSNRHSLRRGTFGVESDDLAVTEDQVGLIGSTGGCRGKE